MTAPAVPPPVTPEMLAEYHRTHAEVHADLQRRADAVCERRVRDVNLTRAALHDMGYTAEQTAYALGYTWPMQELPLFRHGPA